MSAALRPARDREAVARAVADGRSKVVIQAIRAEKADSAERLGGVPASAFLRGDASQTFDGGTLNIGAGSALNVNGALLGSGANLTDLNAVNVTAGTLDDARLSSNIPRLGTGNTFTAVNNNFTGAISTNGLNVGGGLPVRRILTASATLDFTGSTIYQEVLNIRVVVFGFAP